MYDKLELLHLIGSNKRFVKKIYTANRNGFRIRRRFPSVFKVKREYHKDRHVLSLEIQWKELRTELGTEFRTEFRTALIATGIQRL